MNLNKNLIAFYSDEILLEKLAKEKFVFYLGIDPTAHGIHLGHLLSIQLARELIDMGHEAIILIGGFTATIGDPTGKSETRKVLEEQDTKIFSNNILDDIRIIFKDSVKYVNNKEWLDNLSLKELMTFFKTISVNKKLTMETFSQRIENSNHLSMSEFIYPEIQFIDFWYLNDKYNCRLQIGGGDQWGNICFGVHNLRKMGKEAYSMATSLLTNNNQKISKTDGKVPFLKDYRKMYHYCLNMPDKLAKEICEIFQIPMLEDPIILKKNIFKFVYSIYKIEESLEKIEEEESKIFYGKTTEISSDNFIKIKETKLINIVKEIGKLSGSEALRYLSQKAIYIDGKHVDADFQLSSKFKLSIGKKRHFFIEIIN